MLEQIKAKEKFLTFDPISNPSKTLATLKTIDIQHTQQLLESQAQTE